MIIDKVRDFINAFLETETTEIRKSIGKEIDFAKEVDHLQVPSAAGKWLARGFEYRGRRFVQVQDPEGKIFYEVPLMAESLNEGWMNHHDGSFTADMSDLSHHQKSGANVRCPKCREPLSLSKFKEKRDRDNDITMWTAHHDCGADLKVFNEGVEKDKIVVPNLKPRDPNHEILKNKRNAAGAHRDKKRDMKNGEGKYKEKITFKEYLMVEAPMKGSDKVEDHPYSVKVLYKGKGRWPKLKGEIYEHNVLIGTFSRGAVQDGYIPPIEYKFRTERSKARFDDFADSLSIEETIESLLPRSALGQAE